MNKFNKILTALTAIIAVIGFYFFIRILMVGDETFKTDAAAQSSVLSPFIQFSLWVLYITIGVTLLFSIINVVKNPDNLKKTLLGLVVLGVILVVSYMFASDAAVTDNLGNILEDGEAGSISKWVGTGIIYSLALGGIGLALFLVDILKGLVKS